MCYFLCLIVTLSLVGCAGKLDYTRPSIPSKLSNAKTIEKPREAVWNASIPELGKKFYVINNLDKTSGLINLSYTGDPEQYIDCGSIKSYVKNARGERTYDFPGSQATQVYEVMNSSGLFFVERKMSLEGRMNLIFEEIGPTTTRVTASTRYVVTRNVTVRSPANNIPQSGTNSIAFNSGAGAAFPANADGQATECFATGKLEAGILDLIK